MRKKALVVVALLLALSVAMASMAFTSATITNPATLKIVSTDKALITLEENPEWSWENTVGMKDGTSAYKDGTLFFQFGKGVGRDGSSPAFYGLQPNSSYEWAPLFNIRNKSAETVKLTIKCTGSFAPYVTFGTAGRDHVGAWGAKGADYVIDNVPKETGSGMQNIRRVAVKIDIPAGVAFSPAELMGSIVVEAVAK